MSLLKVKPYIVDSTASYTLGNLTTTGNVNVGNLIVSHSIIPTVSNVIDIGSPDQRFGTMYLAGNTIVLGNATIYTDANGKLILSSFEGNLDLTSNTITFLNDVGSTYTQTGDVNITGNLTVQGNTTVINTETLTVKDKQITIAAGAVNGTAADNAGIYVDGAGAEIAYRAATDRWEFNTGVAVDGLYTDYYYFANGTPFIGGGGGGNGYTGSVGYTGSQGTTGYTGSAGANGTNGATGFTGSAGYTGSAGAGYTGSAGTNGTTGFTGSAGVGYTGSAGANGSAGATGYTGSAGASGTAGATGYTGSAGVGYTGSLGYTGSAGAGYTGSAGTSGYAGSKGDTGIFISNNLPGTTINITIGAAGAGGVGANSGAAGGDTVVSYGGLTYTATGGGGGPYQSNAPVGGTIIGGMYGVNGGTAPATSGDFGGTGGGAVTNINSVSAGTAGGTGGQALDFAGLYTALSALGISTVSPGAGAPAGNSGTANANHGGNATGFGCGGGGAGYFGGNGGNGLYGGGGGGAAGRTVVASGGNGGSGVVIINFVGAATPYQLVTNSGAVTVPANTTAMRIWLVGGGGGGAGCPATDSTSGTGGAAGGLLCLTNIMLSIGYTGSVGYTGSAGVGYTGSAGSGGGGTSTSSATPPATPGVGDIWYDTTTDTLYRYTSDGTTSAWLDITGSAVSVSATATTYKTMIYSMVFGAQ